LHIKKAAEHLSPAASFAADAAFGGGGEIRTLGPD